MGSPLTRVLAALGAACLIAAPLTAIATAPAAAVSAPAAVPMASVPVACADSVSSLTVFVNDVVSFGATPAGCTVVSNSSTGNLDRVSASGFVAFAAGSGAVFQLMTDGTTQYLVKVDVTIIEQPAPTPSPSPTTTGGGATSTTATSGQATASASPIPVPLVPASAADPQASQQIRPKDVTIGAALEPGTLAFFNDKGFPLQLLNVSGDRDGVRVLNRGMNYSWQPSNWQRLGYGDLCWSYAGYKGVTGLILPVATPPFATVPADWSLSAAIVATSTGNRIYTDPLPGQVVTAEGRSITALTVCAGGEASAAARSAEVELRLKGADNHGNGNVGGNVGTGQCRGNGNYKHGCEPEHVTWPVYSGGTTTTGTPRPTPSPSTVATSTSATPTTTPSAPTSSSAPAEGDPLIPVCRATGDYTIPYRLEIVRTSEITEGQGNRLYPTAGWTDILPPVRSLPDGQNWPAGANLLFGTTDKCQVPGIGPQPEPTVTPTPETTTLSPLPQPTFTETSPVTAVTAAPQPTFTGYQTITPWPPLYPIPVPTQLIPTPTPTPSTATPSPYATPPSPSAFATPTPMTATPTTITPTPFPTPPSPAAYPTPTATRTPYPTPNPMPDVPTLVPPLQAPTIPLLPVIAIAEPGTVLASPTPTPSTKPSPTATATPTATPSPMTASPTETPIATAEPSASPNATDTVSFLLTNGPDTVTVTLPVGELLTLTNQGGVPGRIPTTNENTSGGGELANTGASMPWLLLGGFALAGTGLVFLATARRGRIRLVLVIAATTAGVAMSTTAAWSVASQERVFSAAQVQAARDWTGQSEAIGRLAFTRQDGSSVTGLDPVYVFDGIDDATLAQGPGWYPSTAPVGGRGNTAIAGHRTGWGSPFADLDALRSGDVITVDTPAGDRRTYVVDDVRMVAPDDTWVLGNDPLGTGTSTLTLTTCDPPGVNTRRLVVFASLQTGSSPA